MGKIKVGEYIRTVKGEISKVTDTDVGETPKGDVPLIELDKKEYTEIGSWIKKHSKNIIDLIEEGDYVNGYKVLAIEDSIYRNSKRIMIYRNEKERYERWIYIQEYDGKIHTQDDIKSIVTKEMMKSIEYKVGE